MNQRVSTALVNNILVNGNAASALYQFLTVHVALISI